VTIVLSSFILPQQAQLSSSAYTVIFRLQLCSLTTTFRRWFSKHEWNDSQDGKL